MAAAATAGSSGRSTLPTVSDDHKRWTMFGIALNHVLVPQILPALEQELQKGYKGLKTTHNIHNQTSHGRLQKWPKFLKYENINGNNALPRLPSGKFDYSLFNCKVTSHIDFAKLYLENHMAKFNAFDETCDASAVLSLLGRVPVFPPAVQNAADIVRQWRNAWAHCVFTEWDKTKFNQIFEDMEQLVKSLKLPSADEGKVLGDLNEWKTKGVKMWVDPDLMKVVQQHVTRLTKDVQELVFEQEKEKEARNNLRGAIHDIQRYVETYEIRISNMEDNVNQLRMDQNVVKQSFADLENQWNSNILLNSYDFSSCESDIKFYAGRYDPDTRHWLLNDFDEWFKNPGESRAFVLLGDAAVGKSVMAAVIAQRSKELGNLAASFFCRHYDGTRRDPRYLLGTVSHQLCHCNKEYSAMVGGEVRIRRILMNSKLGVHELFTKLLQEPLAKCNALQPRKLVIIDALDESEYWARDDFLDLVKHRFPLLPQWLLFFITSRPEDTVQLRLKTYNPCIKICAGNTDTPDIYKQHETDIKRFLENKVNFSALPFSVDDITLKCNGVFLYAFYITEMITSLVKSGKIGQFSDVIPQSIDDYFRGNFQRIFKKVGDAVYRKLFGCALVAPAPLPISFISFILQREKSNLDEQEVIDAVSQFVVVRSCDETFTFVHNLIHVWLTEKSRASLTLCIDRNQAVVYFQNIVLEILSFVTCEHLKSLSSIESDVFNYVLCVGIRFLCENSLDSATSPTIFNSLTNYQFIQERIKVRKVEIYFLIQDLKYLVEKQSFEKLQEAILKELYLALERDIYVIRECPDLLPNCLQNASKIVKENVVLPGSVSLAMFEPTVADFYCLYELPEAFECYALSRSKKLLAAGKGQFMYLFDTGSLEKVTGPVQVTNEGKIPDLEFTPDDNFVFFGRLDKWFSVLEKCAVNVTQFSGKDQWYLWGTYILDDKFFFVHKMVDYDKMNDRDLPFELDLELVRKRLVYSKLYGNDLDDFLGYLRFETKSSVRRIFADFLYSINGLLDCQPMRDIVRDRIIDLYPSVFEYQIWNTKSGKSAMQEIYSSSVEWDPYFYFYHIWPFFRILCGIFDRTYGFSYVISYYVALTVANCLCSILFKLHTGGRLAEEEDEITPESLDNAFDGPFSVPCFVSNEKFLSHMLSKETIYATDGSYLYKSGRIFEKNSNLPVYIFEEAQYFTFAAFTNDSSLFVYATPRSNQQLHAICLQTGTKLSSVSRLNYVRWTSEVCIGFVFHGMNDKRTVLLRDLPANAFKLLPIKFSRKLISTALTANDTCIVCLFSDGTYSTYKSRDGGFSFEFDREDLLKLPVSKGTDIKRSVFSPDGKLMAIHHNFEIMLFQDGLFLCSVFKCGGGCGVSSLSFSPDGTLLLFGIQDSKTQPSYYVWNVQGSALTSSYPITPLVRPDCCCFSPDKTKLIFCNASCVEVRDYPSRTDGCLSFTLPNLRCGELITHCAVSSDNKLLAFCIINKTLICVINDPRYFWEIPLGHVGRIEYCKFLKGSRYLISYGIDGLIFLFDLSAWKSIAYASVVRLQDNILSLTVSQKEDKVICLQSSGRMRVIKLQGLKPTSLSKFQFPKSSLVHDSQDTTPISPAQVTLSYDNEHPAEIDYDFFYPSDCSMDSYEGEDDD